MLKALLLILSFSFIFSAQAEEIDQVTKLIFGSDAKNKFSYYQSTYFVFGKNDLKLQFSGKYRIAKNFNLYFGFTQTMFWSIYTTSQPFKDINYNPEFFYRFVEEKSQILRSMDVGFIHSSNGKDSLASRSLNRIYLKTNLSTKIERHTLIGDLMLYDIVSKEENNKDIRKYMGYWDFTFYFTQLLVHQNQRLDLEFRIFAGDKILNTNKGGRTLGVVYHLGSDNFNPAIYLQYFSGNAENLLNYNKNAEQVRLGLLLFI